MRGREVAEQPLVYFMYAPPIDRQPLPFIKEFATLHIESDWKSGTHSTSYRTRGKIFCDLLEGEPIDLIIDIKNIMFSSAPF
jgi:hypothetical protein